MDFWSRLVRGGTPQKKKPPPNENSPQVRLAKFKRTYNNLLQIWHNGDIISTDVFAAENVRISLRRLAELLAADQRTPTPHPCVTFAATSRLLVVVARMAAAFAHDGVTHEALGICNLLIDSEEEAFLEDRAFAGALPEFVEATQRAAAQLEGAEAEAAEASMVEVLFGIAAKLRADPYMLRVWFLPEKPEEDDEELSDSERRTTFEEFPLFYLLLHYVPKEGRAGEFARMGLLYLIETTSHSEDLEKWIVEGDMAPLMASGLGALYSQLSRKLALAYPGDVIPSILTFSDRRDDEPAMDAELTSSEEYQTHLATFLSSLVFWQDLLEHCSSDDVKQTLLDHYQYLFLQQLIYPSLLESSDVDGGSSVAVLTYLRHILESIDHPDLVRLTFLYLFGHRLDDDSKSGPRSAGREVSRIRRRKSENLVARLLRDADEDFSPHLFNLVDMIMSSLRSRSQQTVTATLQLLSALLRRPHHQALPSLLKTRPARAQAQRTLGAHERELDNLLNLAESLTAVADLEASYERHLFDNRNALESHPCSARLLNLPAPPKKTPYGPDPEQRPMIYKAIEVEDPILTGLVGLLRNFFANDIETNLSLTAAIVDLASCGYLGLEGWLATHPRNYRFGDAEDGEITEEEEDDVAVEDDAGKEAEIKEEAKQEHRPDEQSKDESDNEKSETEDKPEPKDLDRDDASKKDDETADTPANAAVKEQSEETRKEPGENEEKAQAVSETGKIGDGIKEGQEGAESEESKQATNEDVPDELASEENKDQPVEHKEEETKPKELEIPKEEQKLPEIKEPPKKDTLEEELPSHEEMMRRINLARREPVWDVEMASPVYQALCQLVAEAERFQREIPNFDGHLADCRTAIDEGDIESALANIGTPNRASDDGGSPVRRSAQNQSRMTNAQMGSVSEWLKSERAFGGDRAGASSPRGRQLDGQPLGNHRKRLSQHLQPSPARSASIDTAPRDYSQSPMRANYGGRMSSASGNIGSARHSAGPLLAKTFEALHRRIKISGSGSGDEGEEAVGKNKGARKSRADQDDGEVSDEEDDKDEQDSDSDANEDATTLSTAGGDDDVVSALSEETDEEEEESESGKPDEVSVGQLMTNVIILQEFILELAALLEVRATLFGEVKYF